MPTNDIEQLDFGDGVGPRSLKATSGVDAISVNGVSQTISNHSVNLDVASNLITETQWTSIKSILS